MNPQRFSYLDELKKKSEFILNASTIERVIINEMMTDEAKRVLKLFNLVVLNQNELNENDLAYMLDVSVTTIRRDAAKLRSMGVAIYSRRLAYEILNDHLINKK